MLLSPNIVLDRVNLKRFPGSGVVIGVGTPANGTKNIQVLGGSSVDNGRHGYHVMSYAEGTTLEAVVVSGSGSLHGEAVSAAGIYSEAPGTALIDVYVGRVLGVNGSSPNFRGVVLAATAMGSRVTGRRGYSVIRCAPLQLTAYEGARSWVHALLAVTSARV